VCGSSWLYASAMRPGAGSESSLRPGARFVLSRRSAASRSTGWKHAVWRARPQPPGLRSTVGATSTAPGATGRPRLNGVGGWRPCLMSTGSIAGSGERATGGHPEYASSRPARPAPCPLRSGGLILRPGSKSAPRTSGWRTSGPPAIGTLWRRRVYAAEARRGSPAPRHPEPEARRPSFRHRDPCRASTAVVGRDRPLASESARSRIDSSGASGHGRAGCRGCSRCPPRPRPCVGEAASMKELRTTRGLVSLRVRRAGALGRGCPFASRGSVRAIAPPP
jgi:hypothetical protein